MSIRLSKLCTALAAVFLLVSCEQGLGATDRTDASTDAGGDAGSHVVTPAARHFLIVTTEPLHSAAMDYASYREGLGFLVEVVTTQQARNEAPGAVSLAEAIRRHTVAWANGILDAATEEAHLYILILGDAAHSSPEDPLYVPLVTGEGDFEGDWAYGDADGDGAPEVAVGRLPATEPLQVQAYLDRVKDYEGLHNPGPWNKRLAAFAGEAGFGPEIDFILEYVAVRIFESLTYDIDVSMTYAASSSPYYLPPDAWDADYASSYNAGALFQPYIGHTLGWVDTSAMVTPARRGMVSYLSCSDGEIQHGTTLSEEVLLLPQGPMLSMAASDLSHPYGNAVLALELSQSLFNNHAPTYGMAVAWAKQAMIHPSGALRAELDQTAEAFLDEPADYLARTHVVLYNLLGDPALSPGFPPGRVTINPPTNAKIGSQITVTGNVTADQEGSMMANGELTLTLETEREEIPGDLIPVSGEPTLAQALANHATANNKVIVTVTGEVSDGAFSVTLDIPATGMASGQYYLKAFAQNSSTDAMGSLKIGIVR